MDLGHGMQLKYTGTNDAGSIDARARYDLIVDGRALLVITVDEDDLTIRYGKPGAPLSDMVTSSKLAQRKPAVITDGELVLGHISGYSVASAIVSPGLLRRLAKVYGSAVAE